MKLIYSIIIVILLSQLSFAQKIFNTTKNELSIKVNNKVAINNWTISPAVKPDVFEVECIKKMNTVIFSDGKDSISFKLSQGQQIDFVVLVNKKDSAYTRIIGKEPNENITKAYINKYNGKTFVEIREVSELVNVMMALHKDAEKEDNMFDTKTNYYKKMKKYFAPYLNHPAIDTIQKYITGMHYIEDQKINVFSQESYGYYYELKMNACTYVFDKTGHIKNEGYIKLMAKDWCSFDPMKDVKLFEDFAKKSNFRQFYKDNKPHYDSLISTHKQLNPVQKMQTWLDNKFGFGYGSYVIYFSPLIYGAHSTQGIESNGFKQTFMFMAKAEISNKLSLTLNELLESRAVFTEIDHNYVNPVTDKFIDKVNIAFSNREKWAKGEITNMYNTPYTVFNEYMTFAVYSLYVYDNYPKENLSEFLPMMENQMVNDRGYIRFKDFNTTLLEKHKQNPKIKMTELYDYILNWATKENIK